MSDKARKITLDSHTVLCREGDTDKDIYFVLRGKLLICSRSGHRVTPIAYVKENEYFGEMAFFDNQNRSADVITVEPTELLKIPPTAIKEQFPNWLTIMTRSMTKKLRLMDHVISAKGIKRQNVESIKPLSIEAQRALFKKLS